MRPPGCLALNPDVCEPCVDSQQSQLPNGTGTVLEVRRLLCPNFYLAPRSPWQHCGHGATAADPVGCRGINVGDHAACLARLSETDHAAYLTALSPSADIDARGTPRTPELLDELLVALHDPPPITPTSATPGSRGLLLWRRLVRGRPSLALHLRYAELDLRDAVVEYPVPPVPNSLTGQGI